MIVVKNMNGIVEQNIGFRPHFLLSQQQSVNNKPGSNQPFAYRYTRGGMQSGNDSMWRRMA